MYYFKADMSGLYLILKVPYERKTKTKYGKYYANYLRNKSNYIREFLKENGKLEENLVFSVDLAENRVKSKLHDSATIVAKYYDKYTIPSTEDLVLDIKRFSDLRKFVLNNYTDQIDISVDEWVSALEDNSVIDNKMFSILEIMYDIVDYQATTGQLIKIREKLGFSNEKSYNSTIIANSKRVKDFLNKKAVYNKDGTENYWMRFFYGTEVRARNKGKTGKAFQFTLKDELIEALGKVNRNRDEVDVFENIYDNDLEEDFIETERVDDMAEEKLFNSFYDYLLYKGYFFDKETIENYLLSLKAKPFAILTGNSGTGKTKLSQLFAQYLTDNHPLENEDTISSINTEVLVGKSSESGGWSLNRNDIKDLIPIDELENSYSIVVDGVPANANLKLNPRLFYKGDELKRHLAELANEDEKQKVPLEILLDEDITNFKADKNYNNEDYFDTQHFQKGNDFGEYYVELTKSSKQFAKNFEDEFSKTLYPFDEYYGTCLVELNRKVQMADVVYEPWISFKENEEIIEYIKSNYPKGNDSNINIKFNSKDISKCLIEDFIKSNEILEGFLENNNLKRIKLPLKRKDFPGDISDFVPLRHETRCRVIVDDKIFGEAIFRLYIMFKLNDENSIGEGKSVYVRIHPNTFEYKKNRTSNFVTFGEFIDYETYKNKTGIDLLFGHQEDLKRDILEKRGGNNYKQNNPNYKIIPVGANWTENRHIIGYYNVITNEYQSTPAYDLIKAANNSTEPYFLILDEMNLSHVERYFADFLSAIESGEKIPLYGEEELTLPQNLFIIGTVHVDETTYMFSPKVLDRANVIEFETFSASDYMNNKINLTAPSGNISYLENPLAGDEIRSYGIDELRNLFDEVEYEGEPFWNLLTNEIYEFQKILKESGFDFGFRVINEIVRFMAVAWEYEDKPDEFTNWKRYFDACIKQKLLPKLHGSEKIIGETLDKLYSKCVGKHLTYETANYPESARKLKEMRDILTKQRYVSFIN